MGARVTVNEIVGGRISAFSQRGIHSAAGLTPGGLSGMK
jgi:hypothetical protein